MLVKGCSSVFNDSSLKEICFPNKHLMTFVQEGCERHSCRRIVGFSGLSRTEGQCKRGAGMGGGVQLGAAGAVLQWGRSALSLRSHSESASSREKSSKIAEFWSVIYV